MPRNSSGNYTLPAGNPVSPNTLIETAWGNPTMSDIGSELTNSLDRNGRGTMLAPLRIADGTVGAPALAFNSEASSGIYKPASHILAIAIAGAQIAAFADTGITLQQPLLVNAGIHATGNLLVDGTTTLTGTIAMTGVLSLALGTAALPSLAFTGDPNTGVYSPGADQLAFATAGLSRLSVGPNGGWNMPVTGPVAADSLTITAAPAKMGLNIIGTVGSAARAAFNDSGVRGWSIGTAVGDFFALRDETRAANVLNVSNAGTVTIPVPAAGNNPTMQIALGTTALTLGSAWTNDTMTIGGTGAVADALGIAHSPTTGTTLMSVAPGVAWRDLNVRSQQFKAYYGGTSQWLDVSAAGRIGLYGAAGTDFAAPMLDMRGSIIAGVANIGGAGNTSAFSIWGGRDVLNGGWMQFYGAGSANSGFLIFGSSAVGGETMRINNLGQVSIAGGAVGSAMLSVSHANSARLILASVAAAGGGSLLFYSGGALAGRYGTYSDIFGGVSQTMVMLADAADLYLAANAASVTYMKLYNSTSAIDIAAGTRFGAGASTDRFTNGGLSIPHYGIVWGANSAMPDPANASAHLAGYGGVALYGAGARVAYSSGGQFWADSAFGQSARPITENTNWCTTMTVLQQVAIGSVLRTWQSLLGSGGRALNATITSPTYPIVVSINFAFPATSGTNVIVTVGGIAVVALSNGTGGAYVENATFVVPPSTNYQIGNTVGTPTINQWNELR